MLTKDIEDSTIFLTVAGSKAYGTDTSESDTDVRGICVLKNKSYYIGTGLNKFEQQDKGWQDDRVIYDLRKALSLMVDNNPNMMDILFADESSILKMEPSWEMIREKRDVFLSRNVRYRYGGYAYAQLKRIQNHRRYLMNPPKEKPAREKFGLTEEKIIKTEDIGAFQWLLSVFLKDSVQLMNFSDSTRKELEETLNSIGLVQSAMTDNISEETWAKMQQVTGVSDGLIELMMKEKAYANAMSEWCAYQNWEKTRNPKRKELEAKCGYDSKHALHLVRLMRMGIEILETGKVHVKRPDAEELKSIRNGAWPYDKVIEYASECDKKMDELMKTTKLPQNPNRVLVDQLCQKVIEKVVFEKELIL